ncbi:hypothetical protein Glove_48g39 [Diversispora epigaea]|uniref:Uncharacterized protein n=1 Tax=Diversispora epigaea TaxID=1348612 RepID=A0A397JGD5_9GLOM|nr:hypothetical protein Glove_48g39 [Diversispora epigaea]
MNRKTDEELFGQYTERKEGISRQIDVIVPDKRTPPSGYGDNDFDPRFFYIKNERLWDGTADYLYEKKQMEIFTNIKWISCIEKFKNNPSVKGFFTEKACIASIFKNEIIANRVNFKPNDMEFFWDEKEIRFSSNEGKFILYLPRRWNQEAIDGLLISKTNNKLYVAPIQITLDKSSHSNSEGYLAKFKIKFIRLRG